MRRGPTPRNAEYMIGPVRVVAAARGLRVLWLLAFHALGEDLTRAAHNPVPDRIGNQRTDFSQ